MRDHEDRGGISPAERSVAMRANADQSMPSIGLLAVAYNFLGMRPAL